MGLFHSPKIATDGLVTLLDAGNSKSYSGSGTTWKDLSPNQQDATMNSAPSFTTVDNIKHFDFDGTDTITYNLGNALAESTEMSISCWMNMDN